MEHPRRTNSAAHEQRLFEESLASDLGPEVMAFFDDRSVTEIGTNPGGEEIWVEDRKAGKKRPTGVYRPKSFIRSFLHRVARRRSEIVTAERPFVEADLPPGRFRGARLAGQVPPVVPAPSFTIRIPSSEPFDLTYYVESGSITQTQYEYILDAIDTKLNIFVIGGTNSGKTTLAMAILKELSRRCPDQRIVTLEDTRELVVDSWCWNPLYMSEGLDYTELLRRALRMSPDRIVVGESRGASIVQLFDALLSGHPGGVSTFHAASVQKALRRMMIYARRDSDTEAHYFTIGDAVDLMIVLQKVGDLRKATEMVRVHGYEASTGYRMDLIE